MYFLKVQNKIKQYNNNMQKVLIEILRNCFFPDEDKSIEISIEGAKVGELNDRGGHHVCDKFSEITKIRLRVKTVSRTQFYLTKENSLNVLFS